MNRFIQTATDLVTTHEQTRAGFLAIALEKNSLANPFVQEALAFKSMAAITQTPDDFLHMPSIRPFLLTAAGLSDKSLQHLNEEDCSVVIKELIEKFLKPAGDKYIDETIYRFLLVKGDTVGGMMRNRIGSMGQEKLIRCLLSCMAVRGINYSWIDKDQARFAWKAKTIDDTGIEKKIKALAWENDIGARCLSFNMTLSPVGKNVDICLFNTTKSGYDAGRIAKNEKAMTIMLGELKGGIDPAGADEHWKTANSALERIRKGYGLVGRSVLTSFVGAAIEKAMANEIYQQLVDGKLSNAANLTNNDQLVEYCNWIIDL